MKRRKPKLKARQAKKGKKISAGDVRAIAAVLSRFALGWRTADAGILESTWARQDPSISYQASEQPGPIYGFEALRKYYKEATGMFPITSMEIRNVKITPIGAAAYASCDIDIGFVAGGTEYVVHPRATFVLRRFAGRWQTVHYHESIKYEVPS